MRQRRITSYRGGRQKSSIQKKIQPTHTNTSAHLAANISISVYTGRVRKKHVLLGDHSFAFPFGCFGLFFLFIYLFLNQWGANVVHVE